MAIDKQYIMFGKMSNSEIENKIGMYFSHQNKFTYSENVSVNEVNSMISFEGFQKDFFTNIWKEYLEKLDIDFQSFEVTSMVLDMHFFHEALFFYIYGVFKFKALKYFKDNLKVLRKDFYWENPEEAFSHFENVDKLSQLESTLQGTVSDQKISKENLEESLVDSSDYEVDRPPVVFPDSDEENEDSGLNIHEFNRERNNMLNQNDNFPRFEEDDAPLTNNHFLKDELSKIYEETYREEYSKDPSRKESTNTFMKSANRKNNSQSSLPRPSLQFQGKHGMDNDFGTDKDLTSHLNASNRTSIPMGMFRGNNSKEFKKEALEYLSTELDKHQNPNGKFGKQIDTVSKSLNIELKQIHNQSDSDSYNSYGYIQGHQPKDNNLVELSLRDNQVERNLADSERSIRKYQGSSTSGLNIYKIPDSSEKKYNSDKESFELETGRMSQSHKSQTTSQTNRNNLSNMSLLNYSIKEGGTLHFQP